MKHSDLDQKRLNVIVATSGDTGAAAIAALREKEYFNLFVLHPHEKISEYSTENNDSL